MAHIFTPALRRPLSKPFARSGTRTLIQRAIASLRARGTDAHLWLPGGDVRTYGPELVVNGDLSAGATGWTLGTGWSIGSGLATVNTGGGNGSVYQSPSVNLKTYEITFTVTSYTSGSLCAVAHTTFGTYVTAAGTYTQTLTANGTAGFGVYAPAGTIATVDNISVREITSITPTITSGLTTGNYLESTGNTVATVDNPTGLVLDALGTVGAELVTNGDNETSVVTYISAANGSFARDTIKYKTGTASAKFTADSATSINHQVAICVIPAGKSIIVEYDYFVPTGSITICRAYDNDDGSWFTDSINGSVKDQWVRVREFRAAKASSWTLAIGNNVGQSIDGQSFWLDNISVREVTGIHLTQGTTSAKPVLRRGLWNLLKFSKDLSNANWLVQNGAVKTGSDVSLPSSSAQLLQISSSLAGPLTLVAELSGSGTCYLSAWNATDGQKDHAITLTATPTLYVQNVTQTAANTQWTIGRTGLDTATSVTFSSGAIFQGTYTSAQILAAGGIPVTTTAAASNPDSGKYSWAFDGSNDSLALGSVPFQMGDDHCVVVGARCDSASGDRTVFGIRSTASGNPVIASLDFSSGVPRAVWRDDAGAAAVMSSDAAIATDCVLSNRKVGNNKILRVNGVTKNTDATVIGATTPTSAAIGVQPMTPANSYMQGQTGPVLAIKGTVSDADLLMYERLIAALTPGAPTF